MFRLFIAAVIIGAAFSFQPCHRQHSLIRKESTSKLTVTERESDIVGVEEDALSRRDVLVKAGGVALASVLATSRQPQLAIAAPPPQRQTIIITGANSGIGYEACKRLATKGHRLVLACRTEAKAQAAVDSIIEEGFPNEVSTSAMLIPAACDLANKASIKSFVNNIPSLLGGDDKIDCLCLNAGISRNTEATDVARTADGFEQTIGINHFGHFYLNSLLLPKIQSNTGRIVITASGVHDPASPGGKQVRNYLFC